MTKRIPFLIEIGLGLVLTALIAWSYATKAPFLESVSLKAFDLFSTRRSKATAKVDAINIIEIDEQSMTNLGRWPWPRALIGQLIDETVVAGAKVIGLNILYIEQDQNQGLEEIATLSDSFRTLLTQKQTEFKKKKIPMAVFEDFLAQLEDSQENLNGDAALARSIEEAGNVILPMNFIPGEALGNNLEPLPTYFEKEKLAFPPNDQSVPLVPSGLAASLPFEAVGKAALAIGHSNMNRDVDGIMRRVAPVIRYGDSYYPSFGLQIVREFLNLQRKAVAASPHTFTLQKAQIPLDEEANAYLELAGPAGTFKKYSAIDVLTGAIPEKAFTSKIILIGVQAPGIGETFVVPGGESMTGLEVWSNHLENILNQRFISRPPWAKNIEWATIVIAALVVVLILPLLKAKFAIPIWTVIVLGLLGGSGFFLIQKSMWVSPAYGATLLIAGFILMIGKRLIFTEKGKELVEAEGVETNKMLGLSFQGQGMLDLAFEKFRKCPVDSSMKDLLYNLGLDMERKRQFSKAAAVFEHIATVDAKYKDIPEKIELLKKAGEGAVFGSLGKKGSDSTVVVEGLGQNTTLGRYEVMKELGRGAMGIVYLGKDPKINRQVAIKTLRFEDDMNEEQMKSVKERFFREAESAGNLTHPNIIRIFDAGEDQDVAYIAMELLDGKDLKVNSEKANLFPIEKAIDVVIHVADALDYAHKQGVVHRDIKPANIMMLKDDTLRITDFGIARIQATSKTATGAVLGTPAYMSPEQVNGKKVDGRADIFSLGVTFFELLTGEKPFAADSIAALLYRIANVDHPDPREFNPNIPVCIIPVINKALAKDVAKRYQTAGEMANDLRECLKKMANGTAATPTKTASPALVPAAPTTPEPTTPQEEFHSDLMDAFNISSPPPPPESSPNIEQTVSDITGQLKRDDVAPLPGIEHGFAPPTEDKPNP